MNMCACTTHSPIMCAAVGSLKMKPYREAATATHAVPIKALVCMCTGNRESITRPCPVLTHYVLPPATCPPTHLSARLMVCLPQSFEHLPLPQQRLSLYAMGSGMLDMLTDGLDLDAFLGTSDLAAGPAGGLQGTGADTIAPVAPGSRVSIRWLRASCSM